MGEHSLEDRQLLVVGTDSANFGIELCGVPLECDRGGTA
jgi:hypothetical protein